MASVSAEKNNFLIRLLVTVIILAVFIFLFLKDFERKVKSQSTLPAYSVSMCPESGWVDCMPIVDGDRQFMCEPAFLTWAEANCSNFQGAAL